MAFAETMLCITEHLKDCRGVTSRGCACLADVHAVSAYHGSGFIIDFTSMTLKGDGEVILTQQSVGGMSGP